MHHIYHTHGFILSSRNVGEANKIFIVYTREMGLVRAMCQGIRLSKSKLRFALQDYSYVNIDFVKGKDIWRITSANHISSFPFARLNKLSVLFIARICKLLERLCDGEQANENVFDDYIETLCLLDDICITDSSREALELYLVLRVMNSLGYIGDSDILSKYLSPSFGFEKVPDILEDRKSIIIHINKALNESHL